MYHSWLWSFWGYLRLLFWSANENIWKTETSNVYLNPFLQTAQKKDSVFSVSFLHFSPLSALGAQYKLLWFLVWIDLNNHKQCKILAWREFIRLLLLLKTISFLLAAFRSTELQGRDVECKQAIVKTCLRKKMKDSASDLRCQGVFILWKMPKSEEVRAV